MPNKKATEYESFSCPYCEHELNPHKGPIIKMKGRLDAPTFSVITDVFFSSRLGVYGRTTAEGVQLREGAKVHFMCPACKAPFSESDDDELAHIRMRDAKGRAYVVSFNKTLGKRSTFVIDEEKREVAHQFGEDANAYREDIDKRVNFFGK